MQIRKVLLVLFLGLITTSSLLALSDKTSAQEEVVYVVEVDGDIDSGTAHYIGNAISRAQEDGSPLLIKMNTPGGLLDPTKKIVDSILSEDEVTVICWVTPKGAWAYSAGTYILMASDVAVMDDATNIGAAEPKPSDNKVVQAMISWIKEVAESQGRPGSVVKKFVTNNLTMGPETALRENVIDLIAGEEQNILDFIGIPQARTEKLEKGLTGHILGILSNPQVALILLIAGMLGIIAEITTGGVGVPGVAGGICLLLSFFGLRVLELNGLGLALIVLGAILIAAEVFDPGFGVFGIGGGITLFLGVLLIGEEPWMKVSGTLLKGAAILLIIILAVFVWIVRKALKRKVETGMESMIGSHATVIKDIDPNGVIRVRGERWSATSDERIKKGREVIVEDIIEKEGLTTFVVKESS